MWYWTAQQRKVCYGLPGATHIIACLSHAYTSEDCKSAIRGHFIHLGNRVWECVRLSSFMTTPAKWERSQRNDTELRSFSEFVHMGCSVPVASCACQHNLSALPVVAFPSTCTSSMLTPLHLNPYLSAGFPQSWSPIDLRKAARIHRESEDILEKGVRERRKGNK